MNPELANFLKDWLQEESKRTLPMMKIKEPWLKVDGKRLTKEDSMRIIAEWLHNQHIEKGR